MPQQGRSTRVWMWALASVLLLACAGPANQGQGAATAAQGQVRSPAAPKRLTTAINGTPKSIVARFNSTEISIPGATNLEQMVNGNMSELRGDGKLSPQLAEAVPTVENGLWIVAPDGQMEMTWKIRDAALWHDGTPVTGDDFVFAWTVDQDREMPVLRPTWYAWVESFTAPDPKTVVMRWSRPFIGADSALTARYLTPIPKHVLEETYLADKQRFLASPYWNDEYVGSGPYAVRQWALGSSVVLKANEIYLHGRPKIDQVEVRFISDLNTLMTNVLADSVELVLGRNFSIEQGLQLRDSWRDGEVGFSPRTWIVVYPQFINPTPAIVAEAQFRRALMYATDRQQLVDSIQGGLGGVAHILMSPVDPEYKEVENSAARYEYDPRKAAQHIEGLGYTRGADGIYANSAGDRITGVELRSTGDLAADKAIFAVADGWTRLGVGTDPLIVPPARITDREYGATFPSFRMIRQPNEAIELTRLHSSSTPLPENRFVGTNYARYRNPEWDAMVDRFLSTIPFKERMDALRPVVRHMSEELNAMGMFYDADLLVKHNRLLNVGSNTRGGWDIQNWDIRG